MKKLIFVALLLFVSTIESIGQEWKWFNTGLPSLNVKSLALGDSGKIYAGTGSGLGYYRDNSWKTLAVGTISNPAFLNVWTTKKRIWAGTEFDGLWQYAAGSWKHYDQNTAGNGIVGFGVDSRDSIFRLDKFGDFSTWTGNQWLDIRTFFSHPNNLFLDKSDNVWLLSGNAGLYKYKNGTITVWRNNISSTDPSYIPASSLYDMTQDASGIYWLATDQGLLRFDGSQFQTFTTSNSGICSNRLRCIDIDRNGKFWIGSWDAGLSKWDGVSWKTFNVANSAIKSPIINDILVDSANRIWIANGYNEFLSPSGGQGVFMLDESIDVSNGQLPAKPDSLVAKVISENEVVLSWKDLSNNENGFELERSTGDSNHFQQIKVFVPNTVNFKDLTVLGNTVYYYRLRAVNSTGVSSYSNTVAANPKYCNIPLSPYQSYATANLVKFGNINHSIFNCSNGYFDYLHLTTDIFPGQTLLLTLSFDRCSITSDPLIGGVAYIDWNADGDFIDPGEQVFSNININGKGLFEIPITVPSFVVPGFKTRLRIRAEDDVYNAPISPCGYAEETRDYSLNIVPPLPDQTPRPLILNTLTSGSIQLTWTDNSSVETGYIVERSADGVNFSVIANLPSNTIRLTDTLLQPDTKYYYRVLARTPNGMATSTNVNAGTASSSFVLETRGDIAAMYGATGAYWSDVNKDGKQDIFNSGSSRFFMNNDSMLNKTTNNFTSSAAAGWGDYDRDGDDDLFVGSDVFAGVATSAIIYENGGNGQFTPSSLAFSADGRVNNVLWSDYNNDGHLDLYVSYIDLNYGKLYRNNGNKTFTLAQKFDLGGFASFADYDNDGDEDLVILNTNSSAVFKRQDSTFSRDMISTLNSHRDPCRGASWGDYDNDGDQDLFVSNFNSQSSLTTLSSLYINSGNGLFTRTYLSAGIADGASHGSAWGDYDNDGWLDLFVARFQKVNKLYRNRSTILEEQPISIFLGEDYREYPYENLRAFGCAWADYNNDGFLDLYLATAEKSRLYKNLRNNYNWINITLKGVYSNTNGIGARVGVKSNGKWQYRWIESSSGYLGQNSFAAEFGLGPATIIDSIIVRWPSGVEQTLSTLSKNQFITITEIAKITGTNDIQYTKVDVYPNPASGKTYLVVPANRMIRSNLISVYDASGKMFRRTISSLGNGNYSIDLSGLTAGIYWIELKEKTINLRERIVVINR
jgi:hypothetical protein